MYMSFALPIVISCNSKYFSIDFLIDSVPYELLFYIPINIENEKGLVNLQILLLLK